MRSGVDRIEELLRTGPGAESRRVVVAGVDFQRDEIDFGGDFAGSREIQFGVGDLRRLGFEAQIVRVVTGLLGQHWNERVEDRLIACLRDLGAGVFFAKMHLSDSLIRKLRDEGVHTIFLRTFHVRPPPELYDEVVDGDRRFPLVEAVLRAERAEPPIPEPSAAAEPAVPLGARGRRDTDTMPFVIEDLFHPAVRFRDLEGGEVKTYARFALITNRGCPYSAAAADNPVFAGIDLPDEGFANRGCSFCEMGGDYVKLPVPDYAAWLAHQIAWYATHAPGAEILVSDEAAFDSIARLLERLADHGVRNVKLLVKGRIEGLMKRMERFEQGLFRAEGLGIRVVFFLIGIENFSDDELLRFNKGITQQDVIECLQKLQELELAYPEAFSISEYRSHGFILFTPWTTMNDLQVNLDMFKRFRVDRLCGKAPFSRMRMYRWQPLFALAERDALIDEAGRFSELVRKHFGYASNEVPWRFADPRAELVYLLLSEGIEEHDRGISAAFRILDMAIDYAANCEAPTDHERHSAAFAERLADTDLDDESEAFGADVLLPEGMISAAVVRRAAERLAAKSKRLPFVLSSVRPRDFGHRVELRSRAGAEPLVLHLTPRDPQDPAYLHSRKCNIRYVPDDRRLSRAEELFCKAFALALAEAETAPAAEARGCRIEAV